MGSIDLDPASTRIANLWIRADEIYTISDDGLSQPWYGNVFLNPPYGKTGNRSNQQIWLDYAIDQYASGDVQQIIALTKAAPGYIWWDELFNGGWPGPVCITTGRIGFINIDWVMADGTIDYPDQHSSKAASCFWYAGPNLQNFHRIFEDFGRVILRQR
jgi:hypothetical protein